MKLLIYILVLLISFKILTAQVAVIANKSVKVDKIDRTQLLDFYTGEVKKWEDDQKVVLFDLKTKNRIRESFYEYLGKSSSRMKSIWMKNLLTGNGDPPEALEDEKQMLSKVEKQEGSIGFVDYENINNKVKILLIIEPDDE